MDATSGTQMQSITGQMPQSPEVEQAVDKTSTALAGQIVNKPDIQPTLDQATQAINDLPPEQRATAAALGAETLQQTAEKLPQAYIANQKDAAWDVKKDDTLTSIAGNYVDPITNEPLTPEQLAAENPQLTDESADPPRAANGDKLYPGDRVEIPEGYIPVSENELLKKQQAALNAAAADLATTADVSATDRTQPDMKDPTTGMPITGSKAPEGTPKVGQDGALVVDEHGNFNPTTQTRASEQLAKDFAQIDTAAHGGQPDGLISRNDLEAAVQDPTLSAETRQAAAFYLNNPQVFDRAENYQQQGASDGLLGAGDIQSYIDASKQYGIP